MRGRTGEPAVDAYLDTLNKTVLTRMQVRGEAFVSNAVVGNRYVLRACIVNFNTRLADVQAVAEISSRMGRDIDAELRPAALKDPRW